MIVSRKATASSSVRGIAATVRRRANGSGGHQHHRQQQQQLRSTLAGTNLPVGFRRDGDERSEVAPARFHRPLATTECARGFHTTAPSERGPALVLGLATVSALGFAGSSAIKSYNEWKDSQPTKEELEEMRKQEEKEQATMKAQQAKEEERKKKEQKASADDDADKPRTNIFREWFDVGTKYYEGGFEDTMTRREAALVLGVRESSSPARIKAAHRKLLILNHPDTGGSTYLAGKVNEAKELLLKGRSAKNN
ncbi:unnamed protein product [Pseudo-nitzschia multistriata]|uniref:J domain-containing protein n=1 Tax=Pseudo-nitzschia multistriata TaxID=183589 RepID=A0A448Z5W9_9STRA|nr:unnamed protein product [Pseudo-nitzschia multistriata]